MISEALATAGNKLVSPYPPKGTDYWAARFWDRDTCEQDSALGPHYRDQKTVVARYIETYGKDTERVLEFACGTGEFTRLAAELTPAKEITAVDVSAEGLARTRQRVVHDNLRLVEGDFWKDNNVGTSDVVMCLDAIHHLGDVRSVLERLKTFVNPGGVFIGNLWTVDHFHEFQRYRYGAVEHLMRCAVFFGSAAMIRLSGGRLNSGSYRTQLLFTDKIPSILNSVFGPGNVLELDKQRYFTSFVCRVV
nr:methyltransferase type-12 [uncultured bacterium]